MGAVQVNNYLLQSHMKEIEASILSYKKVLKTIADFLVAIMYFPAIANEMLLNPQLDGEFYKTVMETDFGRSFLINLLGVLVTQVIERFDSPELIAKFIALAREPIVQMQVVQLPFGLGKPFLTDILKVFERLLKENVRLVSDHNINSIGKNSSRCKRYTLSPRF